MGVDKNRLIAFPFYYFSLLNATKGWPIDVFWFSNPIPILVGFVFVIWSIKERLP